MLDRLLETCVAALAAAAAVYVAVRLIESVAATLMTIVAVIGGLIIVSFLARMWWRTHSTNRW